MRSVVETIRTLVANEGLQGPDFQPHVEQGLALSASCSLEELADLAECYADLRMQLPLRDLLPIMAARLGDPRPGAEALGPALRMVCASGRGSFFAGELFQFCAEHLQSMERQQIADYLFEAGRHGLRSRHLMDPAVPIVTEMAPRMSLHEVMRTSRGLCRFSFDWSSFFVAARPTMMASIKDMDIRQLLLAYRVARDLRSQEAFVELHSACATELVARADGMSVSEAAQAMAYSTRNSQIKPQVQLMVRAMEGRLAREEHLRDLRLSEAVDVLETLGSWDMRPGAVVDRLDRLLCERGVELKYAANVSLWVTATQALAKLDKLGASWPYVALEYSRDRPFLERVAFHQQCNYIAALSRLRIFDEAVYGHVADILAAEARLFRSAHDFAPVLLAMTNAGFFHQELFDAAYDWMIERLEDEKLVLTKTHTQIAVINIVWCLAAAGYHKRYESFAALLDYAFFTGLEKQSAASIRRLALLAEIVLNEAPEIVAKSQYADRIANMRSNQLVRRVVSSMPPGEPALVQYVRAEVQRLGWRCKPFGAPEDTAAAYIDVSLEPQFNRKVGVLVVGRQHAFTDGLPAEGRPTRDSGHLALIRRMLAGSGWATAVARRSEWEALPDSGARRALLEAAVKQALDGAA